MSKLIVNVICARELPGEWLEKTDPYVRIKYGGHHKSTKSDSQGGRNPNFNQRFEFALQDPPGLMELQVYDQDMGPDDFLAKGLVEIDQVLAKLPELRPQPLRSFFPLQNKSERQQGEVELEFLLA